MHNSNQPPETSSNCFNYVRKAFQSKQNSFSSRKNLNYSQFGAKYAATKKWDKTPLEIKTSMTTKILEKEDKNLLFSNGLCSPSFLQNEPSRTCT